MSTVCQPPDPGTSDKKMILVPPHPYYFMARHARFPPNTNRTNKNGEDGQHKTSDNADKVGGEYNKESWGTDLTALPNLSGLPQNAAILVEARLIAQGIRMG
jgi:hypothetical protein